jgi:hypothetical protein
MIEYRLIPHPDTPPGSTEYAAVAIRPNGRFLDISYVIGGPTDRLVLPAPAKPDRTDDLWRTTCVELFVATGDGGYREYNFAPSSQWASYRFTEYRTGRTDAPLDRSPLISVSDEGDALIVAVRIGIPPVPLAAMGLCAVIEERDGNTSYWALAHGDGPPDFHDPECFVARLPD